MIIINNTVALICKTLLLLFALVLLQCNNGENKEPTPKPDPRIFYKHEDFVMGADLSYANAMLDNGAAYIYKNTKTNPYAIFKQEGCNLVRVRLWHNPEWQKPLYGSKRYSNFDDVKKTIKEAKAQGMAVNLDLHYSDEWADPSKQFTPAKWSTTNLKSLEDSVYNYTLSVLRRLALENLTPEYIQVGNENNTGILHPLGKINNNNFGPFTRLIAKGCQAVRDFSATSVIKPKIIIHVAQLQNALWWVDGVVKKEQFTNFDIVGLSHYFLWSEMHTMPEITTLISKVKTLSNKEVMIVETAFPWTTENKDGYSNIIGSQNNKTGYPISAEGQYNYMRDLTQAIKSGGGKGVMYWEPAWVSTSTFKDSWGTGSSWENNAYFGFGGETLKVFEFMTLEYK